MFKKLIATLESTARSALKNDNAKLFYAAVVRDPSILTNTYPPIIRQAMVMLNKNCLALIAKHWPDAFTTRWTEDGQNALEIADDLTIWDAIIYCHELGIDCSELLIAMHDKVDHEGNTPLHIAFQLVAPNAITLLTSSGNNLLSVKNKAGQTPLDAHPDIFHDLAKRDQYDAIEKLFNAAIQTKAKKRRTRFRKSLPKRLNADRLTMVDCALRYDHAHTFAGLIKLFSLPMTSAILFRISDTDAAQCLTQVQTEHEDFFLLALAEKNEDGHPVIHHAALHNNKKTLDALCKIPTAYMALNQAGQTALEALLISKTPEHRKLGFDLLQRYPDCKKTLNSNKENLAHFAALHQDLDLMKILPVDLHLQTPPPLTIVLDSDNNAFAIEVVRHLGPAVFDINFSGLSIIHRVASTGPAALIPILYDMRPGCLYDVDDDPLLRMNPLHHSASCDTPATAEQIIRLIYPDLLSTSLTAHNQDGYRPAHIAALHGNLSTFCWLIKQCPSAALTIDTNKDTPFDTLIDSLEMTEENNLAIYHLAKWAIDHDELCIIQAIGRAESDLLKIPPPTQPALLDYAREKGKDLIATEIERVTS